MMHKRDLGREMMRFWDGDVVKEVGIGERTAIFVHVCLMIVKSLGI